MSNATEKYHNLLQEVLDEGVFRKDPNRRGVERLQIPHYQYKIDLLKEFPLITTKKMWWKGIVVETLWMLRGDNKLEYLHKHGVRIWDKDAKRFGPMHGTNIGKMYGKVWRDWRGMDQLQKAIEKIKNNPLSSNIRIFGDDPHNEKEQALACCMDYMRFMCEKMENGNGHYLDMKIHYRSWDVLLGAPWNIAQYALILDMVSQMTNTCPRFLIIDAECVHLYDNQIEAAAEQLRRDPKKYSSPKLNYSDRLISMLINRYYEPNLTLEDIEKHVEPNDFIVEDYKSYPKLKNNPEMLTYGDTTEPRIPLHRN